MGKGIYNRGYLPHWDFAGSLQAITFRLADSVPTALIAGWKQELEVVSDDRLRLKQLHLRIARFEDAGRGEAILSNPLAAEVVQKKLIAGHPGSYRLIEWCVMPNHVHVMIKLASNVGLSEVVRIWKGGSAAEINRLLNRNGKLWFREYHDRLVRDLDHYHDCRAYIRNNPVKAGLCAMPQEWLYSSAGQGWDGAPASANEDGSNYEEDAG